MKTKEDNVYAGGDAIELALVTTAIGHGRKAAEIIDHQFRGTTPEPEKKLPLVTHDQMILGFYEKKDRNHHEVLPVEQRFEGDGSAEINKTLIEEQARDEAARCMSCGLCFDCGTCWSYCQDNAIAKPLTPLGEYKFKLELCNGCKKCAEQCPCGYIEMYDPASGASIPLEEIKVGR